MANATFPRICHLNLGLGSVYILHLQLHIAFVGVFTQVGRRYLVFFYLGELKIHKANPRQSRRSDFSFHLCTSLWIELVVAFGHLVRKDYILFRPWGDGFRLLPLPWWIYFHHMPCGSAVYPQPQLRQCSTAFSPSCFPLQFRTDWSQWEAKVHGVLSLALLLICKVLLP